MPPAIRIDSWDDWVRIYNDVSVWRGLVDEICVQEGISYRRLRSASANTNAVFLMDSAFVLKIYSPFWDEYDFERTLLEALSTGDRVPVVEVTGCGQVVDADGTSWDYLITRYCPARPFSELRPALSDAESVSLAEQLGRITRTLHELDPSRFVGPSTDRVWSDLLTQRRRAAVSELVAAGVLDDALTGTLEALLDDAIAADKPESRVVAHGDLGADHVLCAPTEDGWRIEALIDFGDAKIGAPEYEWMPVWMGFCDRDANLARAYLRAYDPNLLDDGEFPMRAVAWSLLHDFGADGVIELWQERRQPAPIESIDELRSLLCPDSIFR
ncbi:MAG: aminoglycoside phosphotransferase family protein [Chloroflexi bacterium]|nr:aminoglycoside phosphotransferase family protein [Chloroflexota bacterium]MYF21229.1 aminoglycoside phosphotransferase family protein [Chloroflexota bacterium]